MATHAQKTSAAPEKTRVLVILDCSQSMWDKWQSDTKIKVTQKVLLRLLDSIHEQGDMEVALRVFGHLNKDAFGTQLEVPFEENNIYKLQSKIKTLVPNGGCTAASALNSSLNDFPRDGKSRNIILIITDGMDDSDGDICDVAHKVNESGNVVQTFIVGIGNAQDFQHQLDCAGRFTYLANEEYLDETLYEIFYLSDQKARVTLALTDEKHNYFETEVPVAFYDHNTHAVKYANIYHYCTEDDIDTLEIDPLVTYDVTFFTQPPVKLFNKQFKAGRHNRVEVVAPLGSLKVHYAGKQPKFQVPDYTMLVRQHDSTQILASQPLNDKRDYRSGKYDLEVQSVPPLKLSKVAIRGGSSTDLQIPLPGQLALSKPKVVTTGSIFAYKNGTLQWVCDLNPANPSERIVLMPGEYQVILKTKSSPVYSDTRTARFTIVSAQQTSINIE